MLNVRLASLLGALFGLSGRQMIARDIERDNVRQNKRLAGYRRPPRRSTNKFLPNRDDNNNPLRFETHTCFHRADGLSEVSHG